MKPVQLIHKIILLKMNTCIILTRGDALTSPFVLETQFVGTVAYQISSTCLISCVFVVFWSPNCFLFFLQWISPFVPKIK